MIICIRTATGLLIFGPGGGAPAAAGGARQFGWAAVAAVPSGLAMLALSGRKARARLRSRVTLLDADPLIRVGHGYDIHRMASREEAGQPVVIGGVRSFSFFERSAAELAPGEGGSRNLNFLASQSRVKNIRVRVFIREISE